MKVDIREQFIEVPSQTTITKDNAPINVDFLIYWRIVDPLKSVVNVANFAGRPPGRRDDDAARRHRRHPRSTRCCRKRDQINEVLRVKLDESHRALGRQGHDASRSARSPRRATSRTR